MSEYFRFHMMEWISFVCLIYFQAGGSGDEKANNMIKLIQNELMNG